MGVLAPCVHFSENLVARTTLKICALKISACVYGGTSDWVRTRSDAGSEDPYHEQNLDSIFSCYLSKHTNSWLRDLTIPCLTYDVL